ncbi:MAG: 4a-hydroxytetrahydrobiopterin dehydratase [Gammaproteobacteria bacterium]|nr:4a-hydroxytetrahydrobiopterin dehydratase [Gammaproteobacteria bacterium]MCP4090062.1 4a-hydroxytetrahydrobiopterin dehydratase [Gammaproteobacteria bacterium]MCP4277048.1 4a-hydroxytetrahydrobiopterin dehydratase [Gammaproteobacteria bacterium]MCP4832729.1 4a-hydroxytetrahydrobiopterin dehydratase [Gammaproteobacteria bacterium]MCP4929922.1 4a-hydroxytetrahydrobiopterin dehydratase [Gammaproteobacteria bacterium]
MNNFSELHNRQCRPCEGGVPPLEPDAVQQLLTALNAEWSVSDDGRWIRREFTFSGFNRTMGFVNALAWIANTEGHHPDLEVGYAKCVVSYMTHAINGLSENDFICAAKIDRLVDAL